MIYDGAFVNLENVVLSKYRSLYRKRINNNVQIVLAITHSQSE